MKQNDNWGRRGRIGMFIVGSEAVPEAEWWAMLPPEVSVHAARVSASGPWARWNDDRTHAELEDDLARGAHQFDAMHLSAVVIGHSSSSFVGGKGWDDAAVESLSQILKPGVTITTNGLDTISALRASKATKPFLVMPPWYNDETINAGARYYKDHGFDPVGHMRHNPGPKWHHLAPGELYRHGLGFEQEVDSLHGQILAACPAKADAVLIPGTGFRCVAILEMLEQKLELPVLSANQASLWHCLRLIGLHDEVLGYGKLLTI